MKLTSVSKLVNREDVRVLLENLSRVCGHGVSPSILADQLGCEMQTVNYHLYEMQRTMPDQVVKMQDTPPLWLFVQKRPVVAEPSQPASNVRPKGPTLVLIDLGNVHDCLIPAVDLQRSLADPRTLHIRAFADRNYNGREMQKSLGYREFVHHDASGHRNAADVAMLDYLSKRVAERSCSQVVLVSKDDIFAAARTYHEDNVRIHLCTKWSELRLYIEE